MCSAIIMLYHFAFPYDIMSVELMLMDDIKLMYDVMLMSYYMLMLDNPL